MGGRSCVGRMLEAEYSQWAQDEWAAFFFEFVGLPALVNAFSGGPVVFENTIFDYTANSPIRSCAASMRARDFPVRAFGPRRSHSTSRRTLLASAACCSDCASRKASRFSRKSA